MRQHPFDDRLRATGVRVDAVRLIDRRLGGDAIEEKRVEGDAVFFGATGMSPERSTPFAADREPRDTKY